MSRPDGAENNDENHLTGRFTMRSMTSLLWSCVSQVLRVKAKAARRHQRLRICCGLESLEDRKVFSVDPVVTLAGGVLQINGTVGNDVAEANVEGSQLVVETRGDGATKVQRFRLADVRQIEFRGQAGDDQFTNVTSIAARAFGGAGNDSLVGGSGENAFEGEDGDDVLVGGNNNDTLNGGFGNDFILGGRGNDSLSGQMGDDQIFGEAGNDSVFGNDGIDRVFGDAGDDYLYGGYGRDSMSGGEGNDYLAGESGNDVLSGEAGNDTLSGGANDDSAYGGAGNDLMYGDEGRDLLSGESGNDVGYGYTGDDTIYGGAGDDTLDGESGSDRLYSGSGSDRLYYHWFWDTRNWSASESGPSAPTTYSGLNGSDLPSLIDAAFSRWGSVGLTGVRSRIVDYRIADLPGSTLAWTVGRSDGSAVIWIDQDAAGHGWFVDSTPQNDAEYTAVSAVLKAAFSGDAADRIDLLTILNHEIGHVAGLEHSDQGNVMQPQLSNGIRLLPSADLVQNNAHPHTGLFLESTQFFLTSPTPNLPTAQQLNQAGLSSGAANALVYTLLQMKQNQGSSLLVPNAPPSASAIQALAPLGNLPLADNSLRSLVLTQGLGLIAQQGPAAGVNYLNNVVSNLRPLSLQAGGYQNIANLTATSDTARMIYNDPYLAQLNPQGVQNATWNYVTDQFGQRGADRLDIRGIANAYNINSAALWQVGGLLQPTRPLGTGTGSPLLDGFGAPIGTYPSERFTYAGPAALDPSRFAQSAYGTVPNYATNYAALPITSYYNTAPVYQTPMGYGVTGGAGGGLIIPGGAWR